MPLSSNAEVLWPRTEAAVVADAIIEAEHRNMPLYEIIRVLFTPVLIRTPFQLPTA